MTGSDEMFSPQVRRYFYQKAARERIPISGTFELTPRCNMNCAMCYIRMSEKELCRHGRERTADEWIDLGRQCADAGMLFLLLTGGEPFLRKDFRRIYTELKKMGLLITINTNATLLDEDTVSWLASDAPARVNVTLYGGSNETYHRLCGHPTGYDAAVRGIELLRQAGILVNINSSFTCYNLSDMDAIVRFGQDRGLRVNAATYMFPPVRKEGAVEWNADVRFTPEEAGAARAKADLLLLPPHLWERKLRCIHEIHEDEECQRTLDEKMGCMAGKAAFWVTWDWRMTPCGMMNSPVVRLEDTGFRQGWETIMEQTDLLRLPAECGKCSMRPACMICGALSTAETGQCHGKPDYLCRLTKSYLSELEKAYKEGDYENR